jgi:hypothetical protein
MNARTKTSIHPRLPHAVVARVVRPPSVRHMDELPSPPEHIVMDPPARPDRNRALDRHELRPAAGGNRFTGPEDVADERCVASEARVHVTMYTSARGRAARAVAPAARRGANRPRAFGLMSHPYVGIPRPRKKSAVGPPTVPRPMTQTDSCSLWTDSCNPCTRSPPTALPAPSAGRRVVNDVFVNAD